MKTTSFNISRSRLRAGVASAVVGFALISTQAFAQEAQSAEDDVTADEIIVTGSLIASPNITSSSPVSTIGANEIQLRQSGDAETILRSLPGAVPNVGKNVNNGNGGASFVDLRGLGANRNIVLLDGVRIVPAGGGGSVNSAAFDLNNVPLALIERVDSLTGGASTTYGADAVSGVVNFITKKNFSGVEATFGNAITERGDGNAYRADLTIGGNFADDRGNAVLNVGYQNADPIYQGDRGFSLFGIGSGNGRAAGASATSVPSTFAFNDGSFLQVSPSGANLVAQYSPFNFNPFNIFVTPYSRHNIYAAANYEVSDKIEVYARGMYSRNSVKTIIAPSGIFGATLSIPANNPFLNATIRDQICTAEGIALGATCNTDAALPLPGVYRRLVELGPRVSEYVTNLFDYRAGLTYSFSDKIKLDVYGAYGESTRTENLSGYVLNSRVQQALNATNTTTCTVTAGNCVPLNIFGPAGSITPQQVAFIEGTSTVSRFAKLTQVHGVVSGETGMALPWAEDEVSFAAGAEYRKYGAGVAPDSLAQNPSELGGSGGAVLPVNGGLSVSEFFGELIAPIASDQAGFQELTLETGLRYSKYSVDTTGNPKFNATTYKVGMNWKPVEGIKLRGNYQRAVRAPNIGELFAPVSTGLTSLTVDPCSGTTATNATLAAVCLAQGAPASRVTLGTIPNPVAGQANATGGGNAALKPEKANTLTFGVVVQPKDVVPGLTLTVDYYNIKVTSAVTSPTPADILAACFGSLSASSATNPACTSIRRNPVTGGLSGPTGTVKGLPSPLTNRGRLATDGIDFTLNYKRDLGFADLNFDFNANYTLKSEFQASPSAFNRDCLGYYSANCASIQPKFQFNQRTTLKFGDVDVSLLWTHLNSVKYEGAASDFLLRGFTAGNRALFRGTVTNNPGINSVLAGQQVDFNRIKAYDYFDLTTRFNIGDHIQLTLSAMNLFDSKPPVVGAATGATAFNSGNTYPSTYDAIGRRYSATVGLKF